MATASENARKVLNSIKAKLNLDKFPRGTFIEVFGNAQVYGDTKVYGNVWVYGEAKVHGEARLHGDDCFMCGDIEILR